jgi:transcriptional regulator with XRE-family HTH domain
METKEKRYIMIRYAICLGKLIAQNKINTSQVKSGSRMLPARVNSLRKLEAASGISFPIIQSISKGKKNPALTTIIAIADGLGLTIVEFFEAYAAVTNEEIQSMLAKEK